MNSAAAAKPDHQWPALEAPQKTQPRSAKFSPLRSPTRFRDQHTLALRIGDQCFRRFAANSFMRVFAAFQSGVAGCPSRGGQTGIEQALLWKDLMPGSKTRRDREGDKHNRKHGSHQQSVIVPKRDQYQQREERDSQDGEEERHRSHGSISATRPISSCSSVEKQLQAIVSDRDRCREQHLGRVEQPESAPAREDESSLAISAGQRDIRSKPTPAPMPAACTDWRARIRPLPRQRREQVTSSPTSARRLRAAQRPWRDGQQRFFRRSGWQWP